MLAAYLDPARWPEARPPLPPQPDDPPDPDMPPGPQPHNGGITPGYVPPDAGGAVDPADVEGLRLQAARLAGEVGRLRRENWELARWLADVERNGGGNGRRDSRPGEAGGGG